MIYKAYGLTPKCIVLGIHIYELRSHSICHAVIPVSAIDSTNNDQLLSWPHCGICK